jgi:hypothetical protein
MTLTRYTEGITGAPKCIGATAGPLFVCSGYKAPGSTTPEELDIVFDGKAYRTGPDTTCRSAASGAPSVLMLTKGTHDMTIPKDPNFKFTAIVS